MQRLEDVPNGQGNPERTLVFLADAQDRLTLVERRGLDEPPFKCMFEVGLRVFVEETERLWAAAPGLPEQSSNLGQDSIR